MPEIHINPDQNLTGHIEVGELQNLTGKIDVGYVYPTLEELEVTPTTERQLIYPERYGFSQVEVEAVTSDIDNNIQENNIRKDVEILGITGTLEEVNAQEKTAIPSTSQQIITPDNNYNSLSQVTIEAVTKDIDSDIKAENIKTGVDILGVVGTYDGLVGQEKTATPTTSEQVVTPDEGYTGLTKVTINPVTSEIDEDIIANNIRKDVNILGVVGNVEEVNAQTKSVTPTTSQQTITPDTGYNALNQVTIEAIDTESKSVKSTTSQQIITPTSGKFIDEVVVNPIVLEQKNVAPTTSAQTITPDTGYDGLSQVGVSAIQTETKEVKSTTTQQTITPTTGKFINEIVVQPMELDYQQVTITENGTITITPMIFYDALGSVRVITNVSGAEDLNTELTAQDNALASQTSKIAQMVQALENKKAIDLQEATSDATATASDILDGETAYVNGQKVVGTYIVKKYAGIRVDFANGTITEIEGSSPVNELKCYSQRRRCNLTNDGVVTAYYGDANYDNVGNENLQVMVEQPKVYYALQNVTINNNAIEKADYLVADEPIVGFELHPAFIKNGVEYDKIYSNAFEVTLKNNKLCSIGDGISTPLVAKTRANFRTYANNRGSIWTQLTKQYQDLESLLVTIEYKSFNHQAVLSVGALATQPVGQTYTLNEYGTGIKGDSIASQDCFTWRWRENIYGNVNKWNDGLNTLNQSWYIKDNNFQDDTSSNYTLLNTNATSSSGWITRFAYVDNARWIFMPKVTSSTATGFIEDYYYYGTQWNVVLSGGSWTPRNRKFLYEYRYEKWKCL